MGTTTSTSAEQRSKLIALFNAGHFAALEQNVLAILEQDPECGFAWQLYGAALEKQGCDGLDALRKASQLKPLDYAAHSNLGNALREHQLYDEAAASYRRAIALRPDFAIAIALATDLPRSAEIRANMRDKLNATPLLDQQRFTRNLERVYRQIWQHYTIA